MAGLPLLKLSGLLVKTIAKPVATRLKIESVKHPNFQRVCKSIGQLAHQIASRVNVLASGYRFIGVKPLEDDAALTKGINFFSESFVFFVAGSIIIIEYNKSEEKSALAKEAAKEEKQKIKEALEEKFKEIDNKIIAVENKISDIEKILPEETLNMINLRQALRNSGSSPEEIDKKTSESQTSQLAIVKVSKKDRSTTILPLPPPSASSSIWFKIWSFVKI